MIINWNELDAARIAEPYMNMFFPIMDAEDAGKPAASKDMYSNLPDDVQCALGYIRCLMESSIGRSYSAYGRYCMDMLRRNTRYIPRMRLPIRFIGWGGEHNEIGPAYEIDEMCYSGAGSKIFYTDDDIKGRADAAEKLAHRVEQVSSGIVDVRAEQLEQLRTMNGDIRMAHWCVTFRLGDTALREIAVNGKPVEPRKGKATFILPKAGEIKCMLGEIVHGDPDNAFVLSKHNYCMK